MHSLDLIPLDYIVFQEGVSERKCGPFAKLKNLQNFISNKCHMLTWHSQN